MQIKLGCGESNTNTNGIEQTRQQHQTIDAHLASLEDPQRADDHGDEGQVENEQRDDKSKQVDSQVADDEEENKCVDVVRWDDCAEPLDSGSRGPVHQVLLHFHNGLQRRLQHLGRGVHKEVSSRTSECGTFSKAEASLLFVRGPILRTIF